MQVTRGTCTGLLQAHQQQHLHSHWTPAAGGQWPGLCGCSCCTIHLRYRHHLLDCGSNKQVIMLRSEGLGVPLGGSSGLGSASVGLLRAWECFWGALGGLWLQNSLSAQNRIIRSNLKNTVKYVINTIRRIIRLCRMTHPCIFATAPLITWTAPLEINKYLTNISPVPPPPKNNH